MIEWTLNTSGTCRSYKDVPKGATIEAVNGITFIGRCEGCGVAILETQVRYRWADGIVTCAKCGGPEHQKAFDPKEASRA